MLNIASELNTTSRLSFPAGALHLEGAPVWGAPERILNLYHLAAYLSSDFLNKNSQTWIPIFVHSDYRHPSPRIV
jgi:hypothetical protein